MAAEKQEVIIEVKVDQTAAMADLLKLEKAILNNKEAQKELGEAYKKGKITQAEYIEENVRLQGNLKKEQDQKRLLLVNNKNMYIYIYILACQHAYKETEHNY